MRLHSLFPLACLLAAALIAAPAQAQSEPQTEAPVPADWNFTLPTLDGDRFITASQEAEQPNAPLLINFWSADCPPCLAELPLLQNLAQGPSGWRVLLVTTDPPALARRTLARLGITLPTVRGAGSAAALMRAAGHTRPSLPYTVLMHQSRPCGQHSGALSAQTLPAVLAQCSQAPALAPPQP
ncbi:MAG: TlpA disulfide reductase family protein [Ottowia sp.]